LDCNPFRKVGERHDYAQLLQTLDNEAVQGLSG